MQAQQQQQVYPLPNQRAPPPHVSPKGTWVTKLIFRILAIIFSIALIGLAADAAASLSYSSYSYITYAPIIFFGGPAGVTFVWSIAELICILARRGHRGIHPGAIVGLDLILWMGYVVTVVMFCYVGAFSYDSWYSGSYFNSFYSRLPRNQAVVALGAILALLHFALFVIGCVETDIRNKKSGQPLVVYAAPLAQPAYYNPHQSVVLPAGYQMPAGYPPPRTSQQEQYQQYPTRYKEQYSMQTASPPPQVPSPVHVNEVDGRHY